VRKAPPAYASGDGNDSQRQNERREDERGGSGAFKHVEGAMLANAKNERSEGEGEAPQAMPAEGATRANAKNERSEGERGGSIRLMPVEGVLNPNNCSEIEGEAPLAMPAEGATRAPSK